MFSSFAPYPQTFSETYRCYPVAMLPEASRKEEYNYGGKIFLPLLALSRLTMLHIRYPMLFRLENRAADITTHLGVLEFIAEEGRVYLPQWMMTTLGMVPGGLLSVASTDIPLGLFVKLEPQLVDFLDISDPKAVLEKALRGFTTLTVGDVFEVNYNKHVYGIKVLETKPFHVLQGICVVETDLETDFAPPVGYVEPEYTPRVVKAPEPRQGMMSKAIGYAGKVEDAGNKWKGGAKLNGKAQQPREEGSMLSDIDLSGPPAPLRLPRGQLFFGFPITPVASQDEPEAETKSWGQGQSLRQARKRKDKNLLFLLLKDKARLPEEIVVDSE